MVERGELTQEQAKNHPGKNVITRAVGTEEEVEGDLYHLTVRRDDCLRPLCSDGLSNEMADQEMLFEVAHGVRRSDCCRRLLILPKIGRAGQCDGRSGTVLMEEGANPMDQYIGRLLDNRYEILEVIGTGGMACGLQGTGVTA